MYDIDTRWSLLIRYAKERKIIMANLNLNFDVDITIILVTACICATLCLVVKSGCDYEVAKHKNYVEAGYVEASTPSSYTTIWTRAEVKK